MAYFFMRKGSRLVKVCGRLVKCWILIRWRVETRGKLVIRVVPERAEEVLAVLKETREGRDAGIN